MKFGVFGSGIVCLALACGVLLAQPASATVVTTTIELMDANFNSSGTLTGDFTLRWIPGATPTLAPTPVQGPFSFVSSQGPSQNGTTLSGFTYDNLDASITLDAHGDAIQVTNLANPSSAADRHNVIFIQFDAPLIDLVNGTATSIGITPDATPYPNGNVFPDSGECERPTGAASLCSPSSRRYLSGGVAAVPETSTWAMMLIGFAGLGFASYRASRKAVSNAA